MPGVPDKFCRLICEAIKREIDTARWRDEVCQAFDISPTFQRLMTVQAKLDEAFNVPEEDPFNHL